MKPRASGRVRGLTTLRLAREPSRRRLILPSQRGCQIRNGTGCLRLLRVAALWLVRLRLRALEDAAVQLAQDVAAGALLGASAARRADGDARAGAKIGDALGHGVLPPSLAECPRCVPLAVTGKPHAPEENGFRPCLLGPAHRIEREAPNTEAMKGDMRRARLISSPPRGSSRLRPVERLGSPGSARPRGARDGAP
jgi:hypothetical protein